MLTRLLFWLGWALIFSGSVLWTTHLDLSGWIGLGIAAIGTLLVLWIWTTDDNTR